MKKIDYIKSLQTLTIKENDILVVKTPNVLTKDVYVYLTAQIENNLPDSLKGKIKIFLLEEGMDIGVIRKDKE